MSILFPEGKKITIGKEEFTIMPFVLRNRTKVLKIIADTILEYGKVNPGLKVDDLKNIDARNNILSAMISVAGDKLVEIYEIVLLKDREWILDNIQIKDEIEILIAIKEVNDLPFLFSQVRGLLKGIKSQTAN